ncbi:5'-nucleotidase C-terminal domain-containing protein [Bacillus sp. CGMCC 1.16607]|uniref:5'-nucleotidase C-terminal domain-containing protein n=1 Tax=Bacillus sp. CGMCC 1.16607 TaxID=3351842 RepID=UPI003643486A
MLRKYRKQLISVALTSALAVGAFAAPFSTTFVQAETNNIKVQLLGVNDLHGQLDYKESFDLDKDGKKETPVGGIEFLAAYLKEAEKTNPNTLIVHSGDMVGGSPLISASFQDEPTIEILEAIGFDAGTLGNHEFDEGIAELLRMVKGGEHAKGTKNYDGINFPMISANVYDKSTGKLILDPYAIKEIGGAKIGFIGVTTQETPSMIVQTGNENLQITDEVEAINKYAKELKDKGIQAIVVLAHNPTWQDNNNSEFDAGAMAEKMDDAVDVIFAAHNHVEVNKVVDNKLIVQAQSYAKAFSDVDLEIDPATGDIVKKEAKVHQVFQNVYEADPTVKEILTKYENEVKAIKEQVFGETTIEMTGKYPSRGPVGDHGIGNMIADGMKASMNADFALMNGGGVRAGIDKGPITLGDLFTVQPFGNTLNKVSLTGAELRTVLNAQIDPVKGLDFQIAGFKYTWNGKTNKIVDIMFPDGKKIDESKEYTVVVNNYMYGNAKYRIGELAGFKFEQGVDDLQASIDYVKSLKGPIEYKAEGRISEVTVTYPAFTDVKAGSWSAEYIKQLQELEIVTGTSATTFSPGKNVSRSQFASMLVRSLGLTTSETSKFTDLGNLSATVKAEVAAAAANGIVSGKTDTTFEPLKPITRAEMATMLVRAYNLKNKTEYKAKETTFTDIGGLNEEMKNAVASAGELGFVNGFDAAGTQFKPSNTTTRAEAAKVVGLFLQPKKQ